MASLNELLLSGRLTQRDIAVINSVWHLELMTSRQIERLHFPTIAFNNVKTARRIAQRRLKKLSDWGLLACRRISPFTPYLYLLDEEGGHLVKAIRGVDQLDDVWTPDDMTRALITQPHRDEITEFVISLTEELRPLNVSLQWQGERETQIICSDSTYFQPDGIGTMSLHSSILHFFLEWDRSTEVMSRIWDKARNYLKYFAFEDGWKPHYERFPPLLVVTTGGHRRRDNMAHEISRQMQDTRTHPADFVALVGCQADLEQNGILGDVFVRAGAPDAPPISLLGGAKAKLMSPEATA